MNLVNQSNNMDNGSDATHDIKITTSQLVRKCENAKIPCFVAYLVPGKGYQYNAVLPEEIGVESEYGKFQQFLKTCLDFNRADYFPSINE